MFIFTLLYKFKPGVDEGEIMRFFSEARMPALPTIPGFISWEAYRYDSLSEYASVGWQDRTKWDWVYIEKWESREACFSTRAKEIAGPDGAVAKTGFYEKFLSSIEKSFGFFAISPA